jgi:hypothetical protein
MKYALYEHPVLGGAHTSGPSLRVKLPNRVINNHGSLCYTLHCFYVYSGIMKM